MKETIETPNGFESWYETFYEITSKVAVIQNRCFEILYPKLKVVVKTEGTVGVYSFVKELTDKFELQYQGVEWGSNDYLCYFDRLDEFLEKELK